MTDEQDKLQHLLNASGFAFQLAIEHSVRSTQLDDAWQVTAREYPWATLSSRGYIDLVVSRRNVHLVVECKRPRDGTWVFLMPEKRQLVRSRARIRWTDAMPHRRNLSDWGDIQVYPESPEADFCVVRGQGETDTPLLERIATSITDAAEGLSADLFNLSQGSRKVNVVLPVIVTTANLMIGSFDVSKIGLKTGEVTDATFSPASLVRFRKSLALAHAPDDYEAEQLRELLVASERTVFVVKGEYFANWLSGLEIGETSQPWQSARAAAEAMGG